MGAYVNYLDIVLRVFDDGTTKLLGIAKATEKVAQAQQKVNEKATRYMGLGFTMLFGFMALRRVTESFLRSAIESYKLAGDEMSIFNVKTNELAASWEFFKYSLIDALSQSALFTSFIDFVIDVVGWLGQLGPKSRENIILTTVALLLLAMAMQFFGTTTLAAMGLAAAFGVSMAVAYGYVLVFFAVLAIAAYWLWIWNSNLEDSEKLHHTFGTGLFSLQTELKILTYLWQVSLKAIRNVFSYLDTHIPWLADLLRWLGIIIIDVILFPITGLITTINAIISAYNFIKRTDIPLIQTVGQYIIGKITYPAPVMPADLTTATTEEEDSAYEKRLREQTTAMTEATNTAITVMSESISANMAKAADNIAKAISDALEKSRANGFGNSTTTG